MSLEMLENWVLIKAINKDADPTKLMGTLRPDYIGNVISVGSKVKTLKKGDTIAYSPHRITDYQFDGVNYNLIKGEDVVGIVRDSVSKENTNAQ